MLLAAAALGLGLASARDIGVPESVQNGYFLGRSGDVIFMPEQLPEDSVMMLLGDAHLNEKVPDTCPLKSVRDIVSQAFGMTGTSERSSFVKDDVFNRPTLNFLVNIHGIGKDTVEKYNLHNINALMGNHATVRLDGISYPRTPLSLSVSLATGEEPNVHGIVADVWQENGNKEQGLFGNNHPEVANIADLVTQYYGDESLAISVSGSYAESRAFAPHKITENTFSYYFDPMSEGFVSAGGSPDLKWSLAETLENIGNSDIEELWTRIKMSGGDVIYNQNDNSFLVKSSASSSNVQLKLEDPVDAMLLAELFYAKTLIKKLATNTKLQTKISDSTPDTISISFRSLDAIENKYGYASKQYQTALKLFDSALPLIAHKLGELAPSSHLGMIVLMGSPVGLDKKAIAEQVKHLSLSSDTEYLPFLYLKDSVKPSHACRVLRMNLDVESSGIKTFCSSDIDHGDYYSFASVDLMSSSGSSSTNSTVTIEELKKFQIVLWLSLALAFTLLAGVCGFCCLEYERDTLLFSKRRIKEPSRG